MHRECTSRTSVIPSKPLPLPGGTHTHTALVRHLVAHHAGHPFPPEVRKVRKIDYNIYVSFCSVVVCLKLFYNYSTATRPNTVPTADTHTLPLSYPLPRGRCDGDG